MGFFHSAHVVAGTLGYSLRHVRRLSAEAGVTPLEFGSGRTRTFKWTDEQIEKLRAYVTEPKTRKPSKKYERRN